jgi:hypothetical protein
MEYEKPVAHEGMRSKLRNLAMPARKYVRDFTLRHNKGIHRAGIGTGLVGVATFVGSTELTVPNDNVGYPLAIAGLLAILGGIKMWEYASEVKKRDYLNKLLLELYNANGMIQ